MGDLLAGADLQRKLALHAPPAPAPARTARLKLLLVGKANVGKTSVVKSLKSSTKKTPVGISALLKREGGHNYHNLSPASMILGGLHLGGGGSSSSSGPHVQLSTDGIDMEEWTPDGSPVSFNVFDFAGQVQNI